MSKFLPKIPAKLVLQDGTIFNGFAAGLVGTTIGELCFNTGMTGYQEIFTDPSYYGQIIIPTNVHIGNYGIKYDEDESNSIKIKGLIVKKFTNAYSRLNGDESLQDYLIRSKLVAISDIDTRALVQHIRDHGAQNGIISSENLNVDSLKELLTQAPDMNGLELSSKVSTPIAYSKGNDSSPIRIAAYDYGIKKNILQCMESRGAYIKVFPAQTPLTIVKEFNPTGYFLSNGPGDPAAMTYAIDTVREILNEDKPLFGICLGIQLLGLAAGITTYKMHHGHRGLNHPVKNIETNYCEITSQNHGFTLNENECNNNPDVVVTHINLNDQSIEGIRLNSKKAFSVQYHPESSPGPHDSRYLFDQFFKLMHN